MKGQMRSYGKILVDHKGTDATKNKKRAYYCKGLNIFSLEEKLRLFYLKNFRYFKKRKKKERKYIYIYIYLLKDNFDNRDEFEL